MEMQRSRFKASAPLEAVTANNANPALHVHGHRPVCRPACLTQFVDNEMEAGGIATFAFNLAPGGREYNVNALICKVPTGE